MSRQMLGDPVLPAVNPTPWVLGALLLLGAVVVPRLTQRQRRNGRRPARRRRK